MDYTISEIKGTYDSNYPDSKKYVFTVEGYENDLSAFSKFPMKEGQVITGEIQINGKYHNFKWGKKSGTPTFQKGGTAPDINRVELKLDRAVATLTTIGAEITAMKGVVSSLLREKEIDEGPGF